jgi:hypothetical protein
VDSSRLLDRVRAVALIEPTRKTETTRRLNRRALTFIELLIALAITTVTCGILAVLISATAIGTNSQNDGRRALVRMQALKSALEDEFINCRAILDSGPNYVVYWIGDQPGSPVTVNNAVNYSELRLLQLDPNTGILSLYAVKWPAGYNNSAIVSADMTSAANTNWLSLCTTLAATTNFYPATTLAIGVTGLTSSLDSATASSARYINLRIDTNDGVVSRQLIMGFALANPQAPY